MPLHFHLMQLLVVKFQLNVINLSVYVHHQAEIRVFLWYFQLKVNGATSAIRLGVAKFVDTLQIFQPNVATEFHHDEFGEFQLHLSRKVRSLLHSKLGAQSHSNKLAKSRPVLLLYYSQRHFLYPKGKPTQYRVLAILFSLNPLRYNHAPKQQYFLLAMFDFPLCFHLEKQPDFQPHFLTIAESISRKLSHNLAGWICLYH